MGSKSPSNNRIRLCVKGLEERCVLSYLVYDYGPFTIDGESCNGLHTPRVYYSSAEFGPWVVELDPDGPEPAQSFSGAEYAALTARFPTWTFVASGATLANNSLKIKDYEAYASVAVERVGAEIWVAYDSTNNPTNIHWIQIITTNAPPKGRTSPYVDSGPNSPYYDEDGWADNTGFTDDPTRSSPFEIYTWSATLLVVEEIAPQTVKLWQGLRWGWQTDNDDSPLLLDPISANADTIVPALTE